MDQNKNNCNEKRTSNYHIDNQPTIYHRSRAIPVQDNCRFCRIHSQILVICAKLISWHFYISSIITNLHAICRKLHNRKYCALRRSLNLMAPNCELCCLSLPQLYRKSHDTFYSLTKDSSYVLSASYSHYGMTFANF